MNNHDCDEIVQTKKLVNQKRISNNEIHKAYEKCYVEEFKYPLSDGNRNDYAIIPGKKMLVNLLGQACCKKIDNLFLVTYA